MAWLVACQPFSPKVGGSYLDEEVNNSVAGTDYSCIRHPGECQVPCPVYEISCILKNPQMVKINPQNDHCSIANGHSCFATRVSVGHDCPSVVI